MFPILMHIIRQITNKLLRPFLSKDKKNLPCIRLRVFGLDNFDESLLKTLLDGKIVKFFYNSSAVLRAGNCIHPFFLIKLYALGETAESTGPVEIALLKYFPDLFSVAIFLAVADAPW